MQSGTVVPVRPQDTESPGRPRTSGYTVKRIDHAETTDRALIMPLLREYFADPSGVAVDARYKWLYLDNPAGIARTYVACADGRAVGITSLFPRAVQVDGRIATGAIGGDAYVTPSFRRRGVVTALHREAALGMDSGLSFMFGPPEPANLRSLLQAGAVVTGAVRRYARPMSARLLGRYAPGRRLGRLVDWFLSPGVSRLRVEKLGSTPDPRVDVVWSATRRSMPRRGEVVPVANAAFYAWRFGVPAGGRQEGVLILDGEQPLGVAALERRGGRGAIVDVTSPVASFRRVVHSLLCSLGQRGQMDAADIQIHIPSRTRELALYSLGFVPRQTKLFQVQLRTSDPAQALLTRPDAWKYMWGDGDLDHVL
jgi:GNAT superfamily N-acetyltransferase